MRDSKLIQLVARLDKAEIKAFSKFVESPYFNTNQTLVDFWAYIKIHAPDFTFASTSKNKKFPNLPIGDKQDNARLNHLCFQLLKLLEEFLAIDRFKKSDFVYTKQIADVYLEKGMKDNFEKKCAELQEKIESEQFLNASDLHQKLSLHHQLYFNELHVKGDDYPENLKKCTQILDQYYIQQKLLYTIEWLGTSKRYSHPIPVNIETYIEKLRQQEQSSSPNAIISIFENAAKLYLEQEPDKAIELVIQLKEDVTSNYEQINKTDKNLLLRLLINACISINGKGKDVIKYMFEIYELGLTDGAIFYRERMTNISFVNILAASLKLKKIEWGKEFIKKESYRLYEPQKEVYLSIGQAGIFFHQKKFKNCLMLLSNMETTDLTIMEIVKRSLKLRAAVECYLQDDNYINLVYANLESFTKFLSRKEILSATKKNMYLNSIRFVKRFVTKIDRGVNLKEITTLKELLLNQTIFSVEYKLWLLDHLEALKKRELQKATSY